MHEHCLLRIYFASMFKNVKHMLLKEHTDTLLFPVKSSLCLFGCFCERTTEQVGVEKG